MEKLLRYSLMASLIFLFMLPVSGYSYPLDGYVDTWIRRLAGQAMILEGKLKGPMPVVGARRSVFEIKLNLRGEAERNMTSFPAPDSKLQAEINALFPDRHESYSLAVLDISPGRPIRFAQRQPDRQFSPGSVGKLAIVAGLFSELETLFPDSVSKRHELLRERMVVAGRWIHHDDHVVPMYHPEDGFFISRPIQEGDVFSLYEWADHMLSASANAAASTVWKEIMLMRHFGRAYPPSGEKEKAFFDKTPKNILRDMAMSTVNDPLRKIGIEQKDWQLGSFFTRTGKKIVPGGGQSAATPLGLLTYLMAMEQGRIVDEWSSLEIKRLMYMTAKRIRYASSPALNNAAVYFKSGSLYRCKPEPGFRCRKYMGNVENDMNSVVIVEHQDGRVYLVALMSNVLRKNSAVDHQTIGTFIDRILSK